MLTNLTCAGHTASVINDLLLGAAAVAGERVRLDVLQQVVGLPANDFLGALDELVRAGALVVTAGEAWFADESVRRDAEARLPLTDRADLHRRTAEAVDAPAEVQRHWSAAVAVTPDSRERARLQLNLARAAVRAGDLQAAHAAVRAAVTTARTSQDLDLLADAAVTLEPIGQSTWDGDIHQWCSEALAAPRQSAQRKVRLRARQAQAAIYLGRWSEASTASSEALRQAESIQDDDLLVEALTARQLATSGPDDVDELTTAARRMIELGTSTGRAEIELRGRLWRVDALWYAGDLAAVAAETGGLASCAGRVSGPHGRWHVLLTRASLALAEAEGFPRFATSVDGRLQRPCRPNSSRRHNLGVTPRETLIDIVVHGQDIAIPIGRRSLFRVRGGDDGLRLVADDIDWSVGDGPELRGPVLSLLLLLTGRRVVLPQLDGPGAEVLQRV